MTSHAWNIEIAGRIVGAAQFVVRASGEHDIAIETAWLHAHAMRIVQVLKSTQFYMSGVNPVILAIRQAIRRRWQFLP